MDQLLSDRDRAVRSDARTLADELVPPEEYAALHGGEFPPGVEDKTRARVAELGLTAINLPA
jgi:alkylation response protein AidB-like acyl-CoA dehydrogenase